MLIMPIVAVVYLTIALRSEKPKRSNEGTPRLPTDPFSRQVHSAMTSAKAKEKKATSPVPPTFMPSRASKHADGPVGVPRHLQARPKADTGPSSSTGQAS